MPPKAPAPPPPPRLDLPSALAILANPPDAASGGDPLLLPQALSFLGGLNFTTIPQDIELQTTLVTAVIPYVCHADGAVSGVAMKLLAKMAAEPRLQPVWSEPACVQALWAIVSGFHANYDEYMARLESMAAEAAEAAAGGGGGTGRGGKDGGKGGKAAAPLTPVDPESTLPGPSKFALDAAMAALSAAVVHSGAAGVEVVGGLLAADVAPLLSLLRHNSSRIQVLALRLLRLLLRSDAMAAALTAVDAAAALTELLATSPYGAVREEALAGLGHLAGASATSIQQMLEAGLPLLLLAHTMDPTTGALPPPPPSVADALPEEDSEVEAGLAAAATAPPPPPTPIDFGRPMVSSAARLQELSSRLLLTLARHHQGVPQALLRAGCLQLLLAALPAPQLPELPPPPPTKRPSSAADTIFAGVVPGLKKAAPAAVASEPEAAAPVSKAEWAAALEGPMPLPAPAVPVTEPRLQAVLLQLVATLLSEPGVQDYWWSVHSTRRPHLQLAYLLQPDRLPPPPPPEPTAAEAAAAAAAAAAAPPSAPAAPAQRPSTQGKAAPPAVAAAPAASPPPPPQPPQLPTEPPFAPEVRAAAVQCLLQLSKHPQWLQLLPFLTSLQKAVRAAASGAAELDGDGDVIDVGGAATSPAVIQPMADLLQKLLASRAPPPPRAAAARAAAGSSEGGPELSATGTVPRRPNAVNNRLPLDANGLTEEELPTRDITETLKALARLARRGNDHWALSAVAAALMLLPDEALYAPPWPPLPSPPPTPPPPPLPTSQFLWDALGRPVMTDGIKLVHL
ncbi:hypothetical protein CHLRE_14g624900v5 [Chlamydomonas reinhardtii]|uniref:Uncharacterized protein n=1 Tax=Chlamydomonas reinhardtii TaxID=3055 RepID=A8IUF4_CHLRE|nr:uncharacterized protein CHLRE_14g624900v5 [Chlamydomonas reinhardtii]PNW73249.1 hypothetical protein CHLRE_14g624900v5 [Chlamydomonas reinhardtii]|eukprot:XP_001692822.1 flagellar associated protein [Chlamydomonas reinhardtii]